MVNILGKHLTRDPVASILAIPGAKLHLYGKSRLEPRRKMGHVTILAPTVEEVAGRVHAVKTIIGEEP
jgi:5-(carboxyamino)imidazole ribonucleotide synthase